MMPLRMDIRTLLVALLAHLSVLAMLSIYFGARQPGARAVRVWGAGMLLAAAGFGAIALRDVAPDLVSITLANTLVAASNLFVYRALRIMNGKPVDDPLGLAALAATAVLIFLYSEVVPDLAARMLIMSVIIGLFFARNALELGGSAPAELRASRAFMRNLFWFGAALMLLRAAYTLNEPVTDLMSGDVMQGAFFVLYPLLATAASFGLFWMENQHLHYELEKRAARDSLTGMLNRGSFLAEFERALLRARRGGGSLGVAMFDLDHFKRLNDAHGHQAGDEVLRAVAASIQGSIRQPDILGRYGGEEFALVMPEADADAAMRVAERVRIAVQARAAQWQGSRLAITISGGVATFAANGETPEALIAAADAALYEAKRAGRNRVLLAAAGAPGPVGALDAPRAVGALDAPGPVGALDAPRPVGALDAPSDTHATPSASIRNP